MTQIQKEVPSLELCKRLKESGYPQYDSVDEYKDRIFWYKYHYDEDFFIDFGKNIAWEENPEHYYAPICVELFSFILPALSNGEWFFITKRRDSHGDILIYGGYRKWITHPSGGVLPQEIVRFFDDSVPNILANTIMWLFNQKLIEFERKEAQ